MRFASVMMCCFLAVACSEKKSVPADSDAFLPARPLAELKDNRLEEVSGLAASAANPGLFWVLNDSNNPAEVYLLDESLNVRLTCRLAGVKNRDWEDLAVGVGPEEDEYYLYVADIGDNNAKRAFKYLYRFKEPSLEPGATEKTISEFDTIIFRLEDGSKDTETIMIDPGTKNLYTVSKREKPVYVYELRYPYSPGDTLTAVPVASLPLTQIVAGTISHDGGELLLKNYKNIYFWKLEGKPVAEGLQARPEILHYTEEPQGEAITFSLDGSGFYTLSEMVKGEKTFLNFYRRNER